MAGSKPGERRSGRQPGTPNKVMAEAVKNGRPSNYSDELAEEIFERVATTPRGLDFICDNEETFPSARTVNRWLAANEEFRQKYLRAKERQADTLAFGSLVIADTPQIGVETINKADGTVETREGDMLGHRTLQVNTRLRLAGKLSPKKYGDKTALVGGDEGDRPLIPGVVQVVRLPDNGRDG